MTNDHDHDTGNWGCNRCGCPSPLLPNELGPYSPGHEWLSAGEVCPLCGSLPNTTEQGTATND